ncbi:MAG: ROK family protein [Candidatus Faecousia sp.]|nr:ROK family protein [Clostridiales bacterium]MDY6181424.1 ROK family protein [Candidatus Faecousia sp.]
MKEYICLDVGGTEIKTACVDESGKLTQPLRHFPARAGENAENLLAHFAGIIRETNPAPEKSAGIRLAFPGPFDYERGICLMQGLAKYDALYGLDLRRELGNRLGVEPEGIRFANDASAFALGEMGFGVARGSERALFVCIGTGCGSGFGLNGVLAPRGTPGVPDSGYIYDAPFLDARIDDYLSRRGLMGLTRERLGEALDGKALAQRVLEGDSQARHCFREFGVRLRDALIPFLDGFRPEVVCLGGQIMKSGAFFLGPLEAECGRRGIRTAVTEDTSLRTMQGLTRL